MDIPINAWRRSAGGGVTGWLATAVCASPRLVFVRLCLCLRACTMRRYTKVPPHRAVVCVLVGACNVRGGGLSAIGSLIC